MKPFRLKERKGFLLLGDLALVNLAVVFALGIHASRTEEVFNLLFLADQFIWFAFFSALWLFASYIIGVYEVKSIADFPDTVQTIFLSFVSIFLIYLVIFFFSATRGLLPRGIVIYQGVVGLILLFGWRWLFFAYAQTDFAIQKIVIVGAGWAGVSIAKAIHEIAGRHFRIIGFIDDQKTGWVEIAPEISNKGEKDGAGKRSSSLKIDIIGKSVDLRHIIEQHTVSEVIIAVTHDINAPLYQAILDCRELGVQISPMTDLFEYLTGRVPTEHIGENWYVVLPLDSPGGGGGYSIMSRLLDIVGALLGLALFLPFFPFIALAIYLDSHGPIFYSQVRAGRGGKPFRLLKLRTMIPDAEKKGPQRASARDPRLTRVGRVLRKMRFDEIPQLINVLKGDMSAVGPRPERPEHLEELEREIPFHRLRNAVKPGMAGWAAVNYGYIENLEDAKIRLEYDLYYVKHQSLWLDIRIIFRMIGQVFQFKGR